MALAAAILLTACQKSDTTKVNENEDSVQLVGQTTAITDSLASPPVNYGDEGRVYVSEDGKTEFRILSDGNESLSFKNETSGEIFEMKQVRSGSGEKYEDAAGNFMWFKGEEFLYGKGEENIASGKLKK